MNVRTLDILVNNWIYTQYCEILPKYFERENYELFWCEKNVYLPMFKNKMTGSEKLPPIVKPASLKNLEKLVKPAMKEAYLKAMKDTHSGLYCILVTRYRTLDLEPDESMCYWMEPFEI